LEDNELAITTERFSSVLQVLRISIPAFFTIVTATPSGPSAGPDKPIVITIKSAANGLASRDTRGVSNAVPDLVRGFKDFIFKFVDTKNFYILISILMMEHEDLDMLSAFVSEQKCSVNKKPSQVFSYEMSEAICATLEIRFDVIFCCNYWPRHCHKNKAYYQGNDEFVTLLSPP
jgi:hypothetical protein